MLTRVRDLWKDHDGGLVLASSYVITGAYQAVAVQTQNLSAATNPSQRRTVVQAGVGDGSFYPGGNVYDMARLVFRTNRGRRVVIWVPDPDQSVYFANQETVNPGAIIGLINAVINNCSDASGKAVVQYDSGQAVRVGELPVPLQ